LATQLLRNATLVDLRAARVERADLRIEGGRIAERGPGLVPRNGEEVVNLFDRLVMPGLVNAHGHLYSALARGMPGPRRAPRDFVEILEQVWWRLDRALDPESIYLSAMIGALDAIRAGTTCLIDHHASPAAIPGSLATVGRALGEAGLRGVLCYEVTDRGGLKERDEGLAETAEFLSSGTGPLLRGLVGAHAGFTLSQESMHKIGDLAGLHEVGVHIHVAEDRADVENARKRHGMEPIERLAEAGCLTRRSLLAHGTHLSRDQLALAREHGAWLIHNARSNMNNRVGYAPVAEFGKRAALGTDGLGSDMFEEARTAYFKAQDGGAGLAPADVLALLDGGARLASELFGEPIGALEPGAAADLVVLDHQPPTPLDGGNLAGHLIFGLSSGMVESVMIGGRWVLRERRFPDLDVGAVASRARVAAAELWQRMERVPDLLLGR